jgi:L,D-peptidoglycan transpeptidase YkuD (ErfK/YbiS/YcfS/YnhG family)
MKKITVTFCLVGLIALSAYAARTERAKKHAAPKNLQGSELLVVVSNGWNNLQGKLYAFKRNGRHWVLAFSNAIVLGKNGLALGDGLTRLPLSGAPIKHEGDKRSPAGIFTIGSAFGYADKSDAQWIRMHYVRASDTLICVDDSLSVNYNKLVGKDTAKNDYNSYEHMHLKDDAYKWGLFVNHNSGKVVPGDGSCIFMHIWENDHTGTDGCTAMTETNILRLLHWLNPKEEPKLVQLPVKNYQQFRKSYGLPAIAGFK